jgi:hypothetical protein
MSSQKRACIDLTDDSPPVLQADPSDAAGAKLAKRGPPSSPKGEADASDVPPAPPAALRAGDELFLVIHDGVPSDTGSDHSSARSRWMAECGHRTEDTEVIGVYSTYNGARAAAEVHLHETFEDTGPDGTDLTQLVDVDWLGEGLFMQKLRWRSQFGRYMRQDHSGGSSTYN